MRALSFLLAAAFSISQAPHEQNNPLFHDLATKGVTVGPKMLVPLSAPFMADGLDARGQQAVIKNLVGNDYPLEEVLRDSVVAKHFYKLRDGKPSDPQAPAHAVDVWFIAYGDLDRLAKKDPQMIFYIGRKDTKARTLTDADLAKRKLRVKREADSHESFFHAVYPLFDKVQVSMTMHTVMTRAADSLVIARRLDPVFAQDREFPNQWQHLKEEAGGKLVTTGPPQPYDGVGLYIKVTRLAQPRGALFVEYHQVFAEPKAWFDSTAFLRSKLPLLVQTEVRNFRRDVKKWSLEK